MSEIKNASANAAEKKLTKKQAWALLFDAIFFELCATTCMKLSEALTILPFTIALFVFYAICFALFTKALEVLPLGLSYGIWGGIGTIGTVIIGIVIWHDAMTLTIALGIILVITGTILMNQGTE
ncbi:MAG: SMR family transporter [Eggerthellales bacterium]|nr:SMR family transporter [Eggerthellales bacterium]